MAETRTIVLTEKWVLFSFFHNHSITFSVEGSSKVFIRASLTRPGPQERGDVYAPGEGGTETVEGSPFWARALSGTAFFHYAIVGPEFTPNEFSGLLLWLDATDDRTIIEGPLTSEGFHISAWNDKSSNGNNQVQDTIFNQPFTQGNNINGKNVIKYHASDSFTQNLGVGIDASLSVFIVFNPLFDTDDNNDSILSMNSPTNDFQIQAGVVTEFKAEFLSSGLGIGTPPMHSSDLTGISSIMAYDISANAGSVALRINSTQSAIDNGYNGLIDNVQDIYLARNRVGDHLMTADVGEVIIYSNTSGNELTLSQIEEVEDYLSRKWGISLTP